MHRNTDLLGWIILSPNYYQVPFKDNHSMKKYNDRAAQHLDVKLNELAKAGCTHHFQFRSRSSAASVLVVWGQRRCVELYKLKHLPVVKLVNITRHEAEGSLKELLWSPAVFVARAWNTLLYICVHCPQLNTPRCLEWKEKINSDNSTTWKVLSVNAAE